MKWRGILKFSHKAYPGFSNAQKAKIGKREGYQRKQDRSSLPVRVANHNVGFAGFVLPARAPSLLRMHPLPDLSGSTLNFQGEALHDEVNRSVACELDRG